MLNLVRLRVLAEVVQRGSFSAAADALDYTQSAVSQAVARLEAETGATLVVRDRRGVRATAAGATLLQHIDAIFSQIQTAEDDLAAVLGVRGGRLRIASFPSAGATLIPQAVAAFRHLHPDVELSLGEGEPDEIAPRLRSGEFDLALLFEFPGDEPQFSGLATTPLIHDPMWVALPVEHPLARKRGLKLLDLRNEDWVQTSAASPCARHVVRVCVEAGFEPRVSFETDDYGTIQGLVAAGVGVALIPRLALSHRQPGLVVRKLEPDSPVRLIFAATVDDAGVVPAAEVMMNILAQRAHEYVDVDQEPTAPHRR
ncbi:MAG TPA: LysR family transcriptional regulator [Solirubrobacteraceae bacterium]|jgi:DNA-binding transcriptional LysR family regulator|nr:LysR family transcriptional regulator [Solirubrobacteraceae bacterium]